METFTERDIELWRKWIERENAYTQKFFGPLGKYSVEGQVSNLENGIWRGKPSFGDGASGRLTRFLKREDLFAEQDASERVIDGRLMAVRDLGKSAHNHYISLVFSTYVFSRKELDEVFPGTIEEIALGLRVPRREAHLDRYRSFDLSLAEDDREMFRKLQDLQDQNQTEDFLSALYAGSVELNAGFIATANRFGWPEPGVDSTLDAKPWSEALTS